MSTDERTTGQPVPVEVHLVESYSSVQDYRRCPRLWWYRKQLRLVSDDETGSTALDLGSWWHALVAVQTIRRGLFCQSLLEVPGKITTVEDGPTLVAHDGLSEFRGRHPLSEGRWTVEGETADGWHSVKQVLLLAKNWWDSKSETYQTAFTEKFGVALPERLRSMWVQRAKRWADDERHERPLLVEHPWTSDPSVLTTPEGGTVTVTMRGRVDEVYEDRRRHLVVLRDIKTGGRLDRDAEADLMDSQLHLYAAMVNLGWAADAGQDGPECPVSGPSVGAVQYDRVQSKHPTTPQLTAMGNLAKNVTAYDHDTYLRWARGDDGQGVPWGEEGVFYVTGAKKGQPKFGVYAPDPEVLETLSTPGEQDRWTRRTLQPLNERVVEAHLESTDHTLAQMAGDAYRWVSEGILPSRDLSRSAAQGASCKYCEMAALCRSQMFGGDDGDYEYNEYGLKQETGRSHVEQIADDLASGQTLTIEGEC
jgi:RecB family exonuclease